MQEVGARMAQYALGTIANMAYSNPSQQKAGTLPTIGYRLKIYWKYMIPLTTVIVGIHASIVVLMIYLARDVVVIDDSHLAIARLLQNLVGRLDGNGNLLDGFQIAAAIQKSLERGEEAEVAHGIDHTRAEKGNTLGIGVVGEQITKRKDLPRKRFLEEFMH
ncbi:MAG: hypothetical protein LQ351_007059 [Letrouitia transgressa]|nr:MAG: hypothetical protein LQ351_007059 [Letrouitia transgressa]